MKEVTFKFKFKGNLVMNQKEPMFQMKPKRSLQNFLLVEKGQPSVLLRLSADWMSPIYKWRAICFFFLIYQFKYKYHPNTLSEIPRITFDQISRHDGPTKLTYKINHHRDENWVVIGMWISDHRLHCPGRENKRRRTEL